MTETTTFVLRTLFSAIAAALISGLWHWFRKLVRPERPTEPSHQSQAGSPASGERTSVPDAAVDPGSHDMVTVDSGVTPSGEGLPARPSRISAYAPDTPQVAEGFPRPNLVCCSSHVTTIGHDVASDVFIRNGQIPAAIAVFLNDSSPQGRMLAAQNLIAEIKYYERGGVEELAYVPSGCWLDEPFARISIAPSRSAQLVLGLPVDDGLMVAIDLRFRSEPYSDDGTTTRLLPGKSFDAQVTLSAGEYDEFMYVFRFEIDLAPEVRIRRTLS